MLNKWRVLSLERSSFSKKEKKVIKKNLVISSLCLGLVFGITSFCFVEDSLAQTLARERTDVANKASAISSPDPAPIQFIRLKGAFSQRLTLPPPCSVVGISGQKVTLKDFYGKVETVEVEEVKNIKVGDKVVVKDGVMRVGVPPT
jgi:hypothetical protein